MEQFRTLLKNALTANAHRICITPGERSEWTLSEGGLAIVAEIPPFDIATVDQLITFLFPNFADQKRKNEPITGTLQIPNVGVLKLLAKPIGQSAIIYIYSPAGESSYAVDLASGGPQQKGVSVEAPHLPPPPGQKESTAADAQRPTDMFSLLIKRPSAPAAGVPVAAESFAVNPPTPPAPKPAKIPLPQFVIPETSANREVTPAAVPTELSEAVFIQEPAVGNASNAQPFKIPVPAQEVSFDVPQLDAAYSYSNADHVHEPSFEPAKAAVRAPGVYVNHESAPEEATSIVFGSGSESEGSVSDGSNPIDPFLKEMVSKKASDMHLTLGQPIVLRVHGEIERQKSMTLTAELMEKFIMPTLPGRNRTEFSKLNDTDYAYELQDVGRFRMNVFRDRNGVGAVMRHIPSQILTAEQLKLPPAIMNLCKLNKGLVLVTGPTGSGKSTTLAAMLDWINKNRAEHILTIEDPIEFVHQQHKCLVNQREVHKHTGSFSRALKAALREDPDVILIGEMRDLETIAIAIETAETGHLVFGTLHTTTAMSTVDRIIDQFPADRQSQIRTMLASSLRGVVTQTLLKKKGGGRVAAHEILMVNDAVSAMVREGKIHMIANHMMTQKAEGNQLLNDALFKLIAEDQIEPHDALFKSVDKNDFVLAAARKNIKIAS